MPRQEVGKQRLWKIGLPKICRRRGAPGTGFRTWFTLASAFYQVIRLSKAGEEWAAVCGMGTKSGDVWELSGRTCSMPVSKLKLYVSLRLSMAFSLSSHCLPLLCVCPNTLFIRTYVIYAYPNDLILTWLPLWRLLFPNEVTWGSRG